MPLDYFQEKHKTSSSANEFGLCDDAPPAATPAYIDEADRMKWIGIVNNEHNLDISFYPVDHCVDVRRPDNDLCKRCDGILRQSNEIFFVELKDRRDAETRTLPNGDVVLSWYEKGIEQLIETIEQFIRHHNKADYSFKDCYVCNKQVFARSVQTQVVQFKDKTKAILGGPGLILVLNKTIEL